MRRINGVDNFTLLAYANGAGSFNDFDQIYPGSMGLNNLGDPVYLTRIGSNTTVLTTGIRPDFSTLQFPSTGESLRPMISDCGYVVVRAGANATDPIRLYAEDLTKFETIASTTDGFTALGQSPALSDFCKVVVYYGDLNAAGAATLGTNPGPGIFASIEIDKKVGTRRIVRLAGRLIEDISAPGGNDDGYCDPGETCMQGELGFTQNNTPIVFSSFDQLNRIAVTHQSVGVAGIEDDVFTVSFLATPNVASDRPERPFSNQTGLWTLTTQITNVSGVLRERPSVAVPVIQNGDVVDGRTVTAINVYDQIGGVRTQGSSTESPGGHRLTFHVATNNGNMVIRANRKVEVPVIFIPGVGGSILAERQGSTFIERWPAGLNPSNYQRLSLAPGEEQDIVALAPVKSVLGRTVYEELLSAMTTGGGGLTEYKLENKPERLTFENCDTTQGAAQPNLFVFAYDWRKSNFENAVKLRSYVRCVQRFYPETEVDIVAHSMGGLVARSYILNFETIHSIRKMVTVASPFLGAPRMLNVLEEGNFFDAVPQVVTSIRGRSIGGANRIFKQLVPYLKGPHELLPSEKYFALGGLPFSERFDFNGDGNITTYDYATAFSTFNSRFSTAPYSTNSLFHAGALDDWRNDTSGVEYYQLFGRQIEENTPEQINARRRVLGPRIINNSGVRFEIKKGIGDETVPVLSAERIGNGVNLNAPGMVPEVFFPGSGEADKKVEHTELTKNPAVQDRIFQILGLTSQALVGSNAHQGKEVNALTEIGIPQRETNYLLIEGSAETLSISDDLGNTNTPINEFFEDKVPGVNYTPLYIEGTPDGWYSHDLSLTTQRSHTIKFRTSSNPINVFEIGLVRGIGNDSPSYAVRYLDLELPPNVECLLTVNAQGMEDVRYDSNGDGTYDVVVPAHVRVTGAAAQDVTAPVAAVTWGKRVQAQRVTVNVTDESSGVRRFFYRTVGTAGPGEWREVVGNYLFTTLPGAFLTGIEIMTEDNVGNRSSVIFYPRPPLGS